MKTIEQVETNNLEIMRSLEEGGMLFQLIRHRISEKYDSAAYFYYDLKSGEIAGFWFPQDLSPELKGKYAEGLVGKGTFMIAVNIKAEDPQKIFHTIKRFIPGDGTSHRARTMIENCMTLYNESNKLG